MDRSSRRTDHRFAQSAATRRKPSYRCRSSVLYWTDSLHCFSFLLVATDDAERGSPVGEYSRTEQSQQEPERKAFGPRRRSFLKYIARTIQPIKRPRLKRSRDTAQDHRRGCHAESCGKQTMSAKSHIR